MLFFPRAFCIVVKNKKGMGYLRRLKKILKKWLRMFTPLRFGNQPRNLILSKPYFIRRPQQIFIGDDVHIGAYSILKIVSRTGSLMRHPDKLHVQQVFEGGRITIGNRVSATGHLHLAAHRLIEIGDDVMFASNVFIADAQHAYENANIPYKYQGMFKVAPVRIGDGCWIGQNAVIMPGVTVGKLSIVGANSVVTRDIPARCIAVGIPARVIKRWDEDTQSWIAVDSWKESATR